MSPYSLLTVRIIKLRNAHQADFCKYQIFLLTLLLDQPLLVLAAAQMQNTEIIPAMKSQSKPISATKYLFTISEVLCCLGFFF